MYSGGKAICLDPHVDTIAIHAFFYAPVIACPYQ
jgi:hypothetical protein